jgi:hypothetical protein
MSQDPFTSLARGVANAQVGSMRTPKDQRQTTAVIILGIISVAALLLVANGASASAVKDVLAIVFPPLVAIAAQAERKK